MTSQPGPLRNSSKKSGLGPRPFRRDIALTCRDLDRCLRVNQQPLALPKLLRQVRVPHGPLNLVTMRKSTFLAPRGARPIHLVESRHQSLSSVGDAGLLGVNTQTWNI